ncbi:MAG: hypothetical protein Q7S03_01980 [bacterium]|nr:hypothetical protein [bacterium]
MQNLSVKTAKIVGTPNHKSWSQAYSFSPEDEKKKKVRGILLAVLSLSTENEDAEMAVFGREALQRLHEKYYGQPEGSPMAGLTKAVESACREFAEVKVGLEITAVALVENVFYLATFSEGQVWIKRGAKISRVLCGKKKEAQSASGYTQKDDLVVLGTATFFNLLGDGVLRAALEGNGPQEAVELLTPLIHSQEKNSEAASLVGQVEEQEEEVAAENDEVLTGEMEKSAQKGDVLERPRQFFLKSLLRLPKLRFPLGRLTLNREEKNKRKQTFFIVALILVVLLGISLHFGPQKRKSEQNQTQFDQIYQTVESLFEEGEALSSVNPAQSREVLLEAKVKYGELEALGVEEEKTAQIRDKIEAVLSMVFKEYRLDEVPVYLDLTLLTQDGRGDRLSLSGSFLVVLDRQKNRVWSVDISRKSTQALAGGDTFSAAKLIALYSNLAYVLDEKGLKQIRINNKKIDSVKIKEDNGWGEVMDIKVFLGNLYLLAPSQRQIWRYVATSEGFGSRQNWFNQNISPDVSQAVSMAVDGSVWLLDKDGRILKYTQGVPVSFSLSGLSKELVSPTIIYTDEKTQSVYLLDKGNRRIVLMDKSGQYQAEYVWEGLSETTDMAVSEEARKIFVLNASKIYQIDLK